MPPRRISRGCSLSRKPIPRGGWWPGARRSQALGRHHALPGLSSRRNRAERSHCLWPGCGPVGACEVHRDGVRGAVCVPHQPQAAAMHAALRVRRHTDDERRPPTNGCLASTARREGSASAKVFARLEHRQPHEPRVVVRHPPGWPAAVAHRQVNRLAAAAEEDVERSVWSPRGTSSFEVDEVSARRHVVRARTVVAATIGRQHERAPDHHVNVTANPVALAPEPRRRAHDVASLLRRTDGIRSARRSGCAVGAATGEQQEPHEQQPLTNDAPRRSSRAQVELQAERAKTTASGPRRGPRADPR